MKKPRKKRKLKDISGQVFDRLTVIKRDHINKHRMQYYLCCCECGNETVVRMSHLIDGHTTSCGCYKRVGVAIPESYETDCKTGCIYLTSHRVHVVSGYAELWNGKRRHHLHVTKYLEANNMEELPAGMVIHHNCGNKACCNPDHLEMMTIGEHNKLHHVQKVKLIDQHGHTTVFDSQKQCAEALNCSTTTIHKYVGSGQPYGQYKYKLERLDHS